MEEDIQLNGTWELKNRSAIAAAITALIGIGVIYFNAQTVIITIVTLIFRDSSTAERTGDFLEWINSIFADLKVPILITVMISQYFLMLLPAVWVVKKWHTNEVKKYLRIKAVSFTEIILSILITITMIPLCYYISELLFKWLKIPKVLTEMGESLFKANSVGELVFIIFVVAVTPAICEEILFRGYFQRTLERSIGVKSVLVTGLVFGLFHMQPLSLIPLAILGILFSFLFYRSKNIFPSMIAHFTNNFIAIYFLYDQNFSSLLGVTGTGNINIWIVFFSTILSAILIWQFILITKPTPLQLNELT